MRKDIFKKTPLMAVRNGIIPIIFTIAVAAAVIYGLNQTAQSARDEGERILEESIRRAIAVCYAIEGIYPESIAYMEEHYGVYIDSSRYIVDYPVFASNIMPDVMVISKEH